MRIICSKDEFRNLILSCERSGSCTGCILDDFCTNRQLHSEDYIKSELLSDVCEVQSDDVTPLESFFIQGAYKAQK